MEGNEEKMNAMPFFHQIMPMDIGGNFMCTPYDDLVRPTLQNKEPNSRTDATARKPRVTL
jgi:hypothetical protein